MGARDLEAPESAIHSMLKSEPKRVEAMHAASEVRTHTGTPGNNGSRGGAASGRLPPGFALSKDAHIAANDAKNALKGYMNISKVFRINVMLVRDASAPLMLLAIRVATVALALAFA